MYVYVYVLALTSFKLLHPLGGVLGGILLGGIHLGLRHWPGLLVLSPCQAVAQSSCL